jgi:hypothetical protein
MPGQDFFERMGPQFAEHADTARQNAQRQADVERLLSKAEYDYRQMRRELAGLLALEAEPHDIEAEPTPELAETAAPLIKAA